MLILSKDDFLSRCIRTFLVEHCRTSCPYQEQLNKWLATQALSLGCKAPEATDSLSFSAKIKTTGVTGTVGNVTSWAEFKCV